MARIHTRTVIDMATGAIIEDESYEYSGPLALCDRWAQGQEKTDATNAGNTAAGFGSSASGISANLLPFLTRELNNPQGFSQQDTTQMLNQAQAGAGGATSGLMGAAALQQ